jgi:hypothetical protein
MAPGVRVPTDSWHGVPGGLPVAHDQPGELEEAVKTVCAGTVSLIITPVAAVPPALPNDSV